tara:strand:+ start:324 stop:572 length:249 start_codon:yes stop_codon:yes gene_type:complete
MNILLTEVFGDENALEGIDEYGRNYRIRGTMAMPEFRNAYVQKGPPDFEGTPCEVIIDDTTAQLTLTPKLFRFSGSKIFQSV